MGDHVRTEIFAFDYYKFDYRELTLIMTLLEGKKMVQ